MGVLRSHILSPCKELSNHRLVCPAQEVIEMSLAGLGLESMWREVGEGISTLGEMLDWFCPWSVLVLITDDE